MHHKFYLGDVIDCLKSIESETIQCVVTSPPYWGLRDYNLPSTEWPEITYSPMTGVPEITIPNMICCHGLEPEPLSFVGHEVLIWREIWRVLRDDGILWLNFGDSYAGNGGQYGDKKSTLQGRKQSRTMGAERFLKKSISLKPKNLCGIPWRVVLALQADGWYLRSDIIWSKPNPMPSSTKDRPTTAHEYLFLLSKSAKYYYDNEAIKEEGVTTRPELLKFGPRPDKGYPGHTNDRRRIKTSGKWSGEDPQSSGRRIVERVKAMRAAGAPHDNPWGPKRNKRTVWTIATEAFPGAHFATFPTKLVEPCVLAGTSPKACPICRAPWRRVLKPSEAYAKCLGKSYHDHSNDIYQGLSQKKVFPRTFADYETVDWIPTCKCESNDGTGKCIVLDPFGGSGTVPLVCQWHQRESIYIDLNPDYLQMAIERNGFNGLCNLDTYEVIQANRIKEKEG
jgi:DNA modification methylase